MVFSKQAKAFALLLIMAFSVTGCYPTGQRSEAIGDNIWDEAEKIDNFTLNLTLPENYPSELPEVVVGTMRWDRDTAVGVCSNGKTITFEKDYQGNYYPEENRTVIQFDDESFLFFEASHISVSVPAENDLYKYALLFGTADTYYDTPYVSFESELNGFPEYDAIKQAKSLFEELGITNLAEPIVLGLTAEEANKYLLKEKQDYKEYYDEEYNYNEWTEDDEVYFITFPLLYNEIPTETNDVYVTGASYSGSFAKAVVTKNGIFSFECNGITVPEYTNGENIKICYSPNDILKSIVFEYSQKKLTNEVIFYNCELTYAPAEKVSYDEWRLVPVWRFDYAVVDNVADGESTRYYEVYNAETGNRISFEWQN